MIDVVALGELLIDFAAKSTDSAGYPTMAANPGGAPGIPAIFVPTKVAELTAMGPGVISAMVTRSVNSLMDSHWCSVTICA